MNTKYQIHFFRRGTFYVDSKEAIKELATLCRIDDVKSFALWMLAKGVYKEIALNNLDFLFSEYKQLYASDSFCDCIGAILDWGLKHLIGYVDTIPVEEHFETYGVECFSKEINFKKALDLLHDWKNNQDVSQEDVKPIEFVSSCERQTKNITINQMSNKINISNMIEEIIKSGATNITLSVSPADLEEFALSIVEKCKQMENEKAKEDVRLSRKEASEMLGVSENTLWRWEVTGYFVSAGRVGKKPYYMKSQIDNFGK